MKVFVSHASADKLYADSFVDYVLVRGAGLNPKKDIFYSSGEDTGVNSGANLMATVRTETATASLMVALVTPTYQTRPVCIAELGAAWAMNILFPVMHPSMERSSLEGILPDLAIRRSDSVPTLDELADRIRALTHEVNVQSWGTGREKWLAFLRQATSSVPSPDVPTAEDVSALRANLEAARSALSEEAARTGRLEAAIEQLKLAKDANEVREILLSDDEEARFRAYVHDFEQATQGLNSIIMDAIWFELSEGSMPWPNWSDDPDAHRRAQDAVRDGYLKETYSDDLVPDPAFPKVGRALAAARNLHTFLRSEASTDFINWFEAEYDVPADLTKRATWNAVF